MLDVLLFVAAAAAYQLTRGVLETLFGSPSTTQVLPETLEAEMSTHDQEMAERTSRLIESCYCRNDHSVVDSLREMNAEERMRATQDFCDRLAQLNGVEIRDVTFFQDRNVGNCGAYNFRTKTVRFNIVELMLDGNHPDFEAHITNFLNTIVHEYRHAVQHRAMREKGFWEVEDERRARWADNLPPKYILAQNDPRGYRMQPIEKDAFTYAALVMRGVR